MSDDEADPELLELLRKSLGISRGGEDEVSSDTGVLKSAEHVYNNAIDVSIDMYGTKNAAASIYQSMQERNYSTEAWSQHELHPKVSEGFSEIAIVNFILTMDLLNFSFWSDRSETERYQVEYKGNRWTGYWSLVACLRRALDEGIPVTTPRFWRSADSLAKIKHAFRSATEEEMPMLDERLSLLPEAAYVLAQWDDDQADVEQGALDPGRGTDTSLEMRADTSSDGGIATSGSVAVVPEQPPQNVPSSSQDELKQFPLIDQDSSAANSATAIPPESAVSDQDALANIPVDVAAQAADTKHSPDDEQQTPTISAAHEQPPVVADQRPDESVVRLVKQADHSAGRLVNLLAKHFACFRDETRFDGRRVRLMKRAQIFVADLWAALNGTGYGAFNDIDHLTMFADYRVPQMLHSLGVLSYSPPLEYRIRDLKEIESGHSWEVQLRGCSIWAVELIRREILAQHPEAEVNAVLIDFFLYDLAKEREAVQGGLAVPHHRTRSIWY